MTDYDLDKIELLNPPVKTGVLSVLPDFYAITLAVRELTAEMKNLANAIRNQR